MPSAIQLRGMSSNAGLRRIDLNLERIKAVLAKLGNPQKSFPVIHVAGTNGKGSTVHYLSSILRQCSSLKIATFTTPHLRFESDSCQIDGKPIDSAIWQYATNVVQEVQEKYSMPCTPFESLTARCLVSWDSLPEGDRPDVLIVEVGMGGTLDATNVFEPSQVLASVICVIDYDHQAILGSTLSEIASHKAGIVKDRGLCVVADQAREAGTQQVKNSELNEVLQSIQHICQQREARVVWSSFPSDVLNDIGALRTNSTHLWATSVSTKIRYQPIQSASDTIAEASRQSHGTTEFVGPTLQLPATRAAIMGSHLALQTLWSIARDDTRLALGFAGRDRFELVRLKIAYALRSEQEGSEAINRAIEQHTPLPGRASWLTLPLQTADSNSNTDDPPHLLALVDGAHNPAASHALRNYINACLIASGTKDVILTWVLALSNGKPVHEILHALLDDAGISSDKSSLVQGASHLNLDGNGVQQIKVRHRIAAVPFTTPVEGMPWIECMPPVDIVQAAQTFRSAAHAEVVDSRAFDDLPSALLWASKATPGLSARRADDRESMVICAGSLYLVSDVYRSLHAE